MPTTSTEISYSVAGDGPGLVLVHGTGGRATTTWSEIEPHLALTRTVVAPDLRGCGASRPADGPLALDELSADVIAAAADAGLERFDLVGFSLGAAIATQLAADQPDRVESLTLVAPPSPVPNGRTALQFGLWADLVEASPRQFAQLWLLTGFGRGFVARIPVEQIDRAAHFPIEPATAAQSRLNADLDLRDVLGRVRARTLVVTCAADVVNPPGPESLGLLENASATRHLQLNSGHMVVLERPDELADAILAFLAEGE
ncbi:MAG: alpha/beta fold hydrolase [Thermomicrobiales bacterium]|nr:alpha/beta fold hydrolase [Thermomicrobiales bacterium]